MPFFVQVLNEGTLRRLIEAYSTFEAIPQMRLYGHYARPEFVRKEWIDTHIGKIQSSFRTAGQEMDRLQTKLSLCERFKSYLWVRAT